MKIELSKFICNNCKKESNIVDKESGYPYKDGWKYCYKISVKGSKNGTIDICDAHYCSRVCLIESLSKATEIWEKLDNEK